MHDIADAEAARRILTNAGADEVDVRVVEMGGGWLVSVRGWGAGATDATDETMDTPQEVAEALVRARRQLEPEPNSPEQPYTAPAPEPEGTDEPEEQATSEPEPEPEYEPVEPAPVFVFGDNLATDRLVRIGQITEHALGLIEAARAAVGYDQAEFEALNHHVVTNLAAATAAYIGGDQPSYERWCVLSATQSRVAVIEDYRDAQIDIIRGADHQTVATFQPEEGWP